jgi:hypothetical protein
VSRQPITTFLAVIKILDDQLGVFGSELRRSDRAEVRSAINRRDRQAGVARRAAGVRAP